MTPNIIESIYKKAEYLKHKLAEIYEKKTISKTSRYLNDIR